MTRFIMSLDQAVQLVIELIALALPGDVLMTKMPAIRISDLAEVMVREFAPRCGRRPGKHRNHGAEDSDLARSFTRN